MKPFNTKLLTRYELLQDFRSNADDFFLQHYGQKLEEMPVAVDKLLGKLVELIPAAAFDGESLNDIGYVTLLGMFDDEVAEEFINECFYVHLNVPLDVPLTIEMSSEGGEISASLAMIGALNRIRREGRKVHIHVTGYAMSAAQDLLQFADVRSIDPHGFLMLHEDQYESEGSTSRHRNEVAFSRKQVRQMLESLCLRTGRTLEYYLKKINNAEWYVTAEQALAEGLVDKIVPIPPFSPSIAAPAVKRKRAVKAKPPLPEALDVTDSIPQ